MNFAPRHSLPTLSTSFIPPFLLLLPYFLSFLLVLWYHSAFPLLLLLHPPSFPIVSSSLAGFVSCWRLRGDVEQIKLSGSSSSPPPPPYNVRYNLPPAVWSLHPSRNPLCNKTAIRSGLHGAGTVLEAVMWGAWRFGPWAQVRVTGIISQLWLSKVCWFPRWQKQQSEMIGCLNASGVRAPFHMSVPNTVGIYRTSVRPLLAGCSRAHKLLHVSR